MADMGTTDIRLGCQGWTETDWQGIFYPEGLKVGDRLATYSSVFDFVEIDSSFYASPAPGTVIKWLDSTPEDFRFAAKVPQAITHDPDPKTRYPRRPLQGERWQAHLAGFAETMGLLGDRLVALVAQMPPQWHWKPEQVRVLETFLKALPGGLPWAMEFRHRGWLNEEVFGLLSEHQVTFVMQDLYYMPRHVEVTQPSLAYIRLQGRRKEITHMDALQIERDDALDFWAEVVRDLASRGVVRIAVAANNHYQGFSPGTIAALQARLGLPVSPPPAGLTRRLPLEAPPAA